MTEIKEFFRIIFQLVLSVPFAAASWIAIVPFFAALGSRIGDNANIYSFAATAFVAIIVVIAPTFRRSVGRGFILVAIYLFLLPVSITFLGVEVSSNVIEQTEQTDDIGVLAGVYTASTIAETGAGILTGFLGFFLGTASLIIGLVLSLGGKREVVIVDAAEKKISRDNAYKPITTSSEKPFIDARGRREPTISANLKEKLKSE